MENVNNKLEDSRAEKIINQITQLSDEDIKNISDEKFEELFNKLNPYKHVIQESTDVISFSYTNLRQEYIKKLIITGFVGFLNRMCDEWNVPTNCTAVPVYDYYKNPEQYDKPFEDNLDKFSEETRRDYFYNKEKMKERYIVKKFLEDMFQFSPDNHVRSSYDPNKNDVYREIVKNEASETALKTENDQGIKIDEYKKEHQEDYHYNMIPPRDTFYRFETYFEGNYNAIAKACHDIYADKPGLEIAFNPHKAHKTLEEAEEFMMKHRKTATMPIFTAQCGKWNIITPYEEMIKNRKLFDEKNSILDTLFKSREKDQEMAKELLNRRVKDTKKSSAKFEDDEESDFVNKWLKSRKDTYEMANDFLEEEEKDPVYDVPVYKFSKGKWEKDSFKAYK